MRAHFGTDGIRGRANENLTVDMAYRIGQYLGHTFVSGKILIGKDTRLSSSMLEAALSAGISTCGGNAYQLGVCSTPSLVYLVKNENFDGGIMITASHNPYYDNGIKIISAEGSKIDSAFEQKIEDYIYSDRNLPLAIGQQIGQIKDYRKGLDDYYRHLFTEFPLDLSAYKIIIDCANGSSTITAPYVFEKLNAQLTVTNNQPDGYNINRDCGSTHINKLVAEVKKGNYDVGFAFDGDADRVIAVTSDGQIVDGDKIIYCCGKYLQEKGLLKNGKVVTTVMANLGLFKKLDEQHIGYEKTQVGDKYVYQCMQENGYVLGGEQSGHIIFSQYASTGDGLLTSLMLLKVMKETGKSLNELTDDLFIYPQILINVEVKDKEECLKNKQLLEKCAQVQKALQDNGRVLVRASGTESLVRVMIEAQNDQLCQKYADEIVQVIEEINN
ncbi:MAG: phosphoglucosamine mutase [Erysipelotrichia bacterium]|nr:phosphoglucosamine mutase [Erysipelotrichia bacterium]